MPIGVRRLESFLVESNITERPLGLNAVNWQHPVATEGLQFAWLADGSALCPDLCLNQVPTVTGTAPTWAIKNQIGDVLGFSGSNYLSFSGRRTVADNTCTIAGVVQRNNTSNAWFFTNSGANAGWRVGISGNWALVKGAVVVVDSGIAPGADSARGLVTEFPYFFAVTTDGATAHFVVKRLDTGTIQTASVTVTGAAAGAPDGTYEIGEISGLAQGWAGAVSAVVYNSDFVGLQTLLDWADDPWGIFSGEQEYAYVIRGSAGVDASFNLVGVAGTGAAGALASSIAEALTGVAGIGMAAPLTALAAATFSGVAATGAVGSLSFTATGSAALVGVAGIGLAGAIAAPAVASQIQIEALAGADSEVRASQLVIEALAPVTIADPQIHASQFAIEILVLNWTPPMPRIYPQLPGLAYSVVKRPIHNNLVRQAPSLREVRIGMADDPVYEFDLSYDLLPDRHPAVVTMRGLKTLFGFYLQHGGGLRGFLLPDPDDRAVTAQSLGSTDGGVRYGIVRTYGDGEFGGTEPVGQVDTTAPFNLYLDGALVDPGAYDVLTTPLGDNAIHFHATPAADQALTADFSFFYYARFKDDQLDFEQFMRLLWQAKKVTLRSLGSES